MNLKNKRGMELVQVAILVAIAVTLGLIFRERIVDFINGTFDSLESSGFKEMNASRRGSVFVEAAPIFPIIILTVAILIGYSSNSYEKVRKQIEEHNEQRRIHGGRRIDKGECDFVRNIDFLMEEL